MVNITNTPVQVGDSFSTKYTGQATPTATDFIFSSVQDSIIVTNYGISSYITAISSGESVRIHPNGGTYRFKVDSDKVNIQSSYGTTNPVTIEGRSFASGSGAGVDTSNLATKTEVTAKADKTYVDGKIGSIGNTKTFKGSIAFASLPTSGNANGDYYYVTDQTTNYCWNGTTWINIGNNFSLGEGTVTPNSANFFDATVGKNLYNPATVTLGERITTGGSIQTGASYMHNDFTKVTPGKIIVYSRLSSGNRTTLNVTYTTAYDANKNVLSSSGASNTASYTVPSGVAFIKCSFDQGYNSDVQIESTTDGVMTAYEAYKDPTYTLKPQYISDFVDVKINNKIDPATADLVANLINIPSKIRELTTMEMSVFYENIINKSTQKDVVVTCGQGTQSDKRFYGTLTSNQSLLIELYKDGQKVTGKTASVVVKDPATITSSFNVHFIGDSTCGNIADQTHASFSSDTYSPATFIGTRTTGNTLHDGRAGWGTGTYVSVASSGGLTNDFWNPSTSKFDYSYFMQQKGFTAPSHVVFDLGINDISQIKTDDNLKTAVTTAFTNFDTMINSIKTYNSAIKICLGIPTPPNVSQEKFDIMYKTQQWRYKRNYDYFVSEYIKKYDNREAELIYVIPMNLSLDTTVDIGDAVHPDYTTGSKKAGQQVYKALKGIG